jgi:hypothetical protein
MSFNRRNFVVLALLSVPACKKDVPPTPASAASASAATAGAAPAPAASSLAILDGFEGAVTLHAKGSASAKDTTTKDVTLALLVKDGKFRVDLPEELTGSSQLGKAFVIVKPAEKKLLAVMDAKKQAVLVDFDKLASQAQAMSKLHRPGGASASADETPPVVQKTGKIDTVAGYKCEIWHIAKGSSAGDLCIGEQGTSWFHIPLVGVPAQYAWASEITDGKHFPLRVVVSENGIEHGRLEVVSIQKKALSAADFEVPAGYNVLDLEQMMGAMMGGLRGMPPGAMPSGMPGMPPGFPPAGMRPPKPKH